MTLSGGCGINRSKKNILCYADDNVVLAPIVEALQVWLDSPTGPVRAFSLKSSVQQPNHIFIRHKNRKLISTAKTDNQILKTI